MSEYNIQMNKYNALNAGYDQLYPVTKIKNVDGLDTALQSKPNPNLLDNWYFGNPVNQRGITSCTGGNYSIDRWALGTSDSFASLSVDSDGISITASSDKNSQFIQGLGRDLSLSLVGKTITISALFKNVSGKVSISFARSKTAMNNIAGVGGYVTTTNSGLISITFTVPDVLESAEFFNVIFTTFAGGQSKIEAAKLELGDQQTLAHQDANGNWVLNEIPNYGEQLVRCQRYYRQFNAYTKFVAQYIDGTKVVFVLPVSMRTAPGMRGDWKIYTGFTGQTGFTLNTYQTGNIIVVEAVKENHGLTSAWLGVDGDGYGILNAEL